MKPTNDFEFCPRVAEAQQAACQTCRVYQHPRQQHFVLVPQPAVTRSKVLKDSGLPALRRNFKPGYARSKSSKVSDMRGRPPVGRRLRFERVCRTLEHSLCENTLSPMSIEARSRYLEIKMICLGSTSAHRSLCRRLCQSRASMKAGGQLQPGQCILQVMCATFFSLASQTLGLHHLNQ